MAMNDGDRGSVVQAEIIDLTRRNTGATREDPESSSSGELSFLLPSGSSIPTPSTSENLAAGEIPSVPVATVVKGVVSTSVLVCLVAVGFGIFGIIQTSLLQGRIQPVDKQKCTCDCFDGFIKGIFFARPAEGQYKSIYFNMDFTTWLLVSWFVLCGAALSKLAAKLNQMFWAGRLGWHLLAVLPPLIWLMQYNFTVLFHYLNDRFGNMILFNVQVFFNITSFVYAIAVYHSIDRQVRAPEPLVMMAQGVLASHIFIALYEQGLEHFINLNAHLTHLIRDSMFFFCDLTLMIFLARCSGKFTQRKLIWSACSFFVCMILFRIALWLA